MLPLHFPPANSRAAAPLASRALGDCRRRQRAMTIVKAMRDAPGKSIPALFESPYQIKACYEFFKHPKATPENIQAEHRALVREEMTRGTILLPEDTTDMTWPGNEPVQGLGPIGVGAEGLQGFRLHSTLALRWPEPNEPGAKRPPVQALGLADQIYHVRKPRPEKEPARSPARHQDRWRESALWSEATERLGRPPETARWERVCDREADIYEFLHGCREAGHGFIVRAAQNRVARDAETNEQSRLFTQARQAPPLGTFLLELRARPGQPARVAPMTVSVAGALDILSPQRPGCGPGQLPPVRCWVVRAWETAPPEGNAPLEWILLHDRPVKTFDAALEVMLKYQTRWLIEEFHKALKTGLGAERLQLTAASRLFAAISLMSVVALELIDLRERVRLHPEAPASESGLSPLELRLLAARLKRELHTVRDVALALGRLGGHMNRKADGMPGWITLWRGLRELHVLIQGFSLIRQVLEFG